MCKIETKNTKKNMKAIFTFFVSLLFCLSVKAQTDVTSEYIQNPSFENSTSGWTTENLASQSNNSFTKKDGTYYMEKWVGSGSVGSGYAIQTINGLPVGKYLLTVAAQNYTQTNTTKKNTGAYIYAGDQQTTVYTPNDYSVTFTNITGQVEIGFVAENATGNWIAVDNFRLYKTEDVDDATIKAEVERLINEGTALKESVMSNEADSILQEAITSASDMINGEGTYDPSVTLALQQAISNAKVSISEFATLKTAIDDAKTKVDSSKEGTEEFEAAINNAITVYENTGSTSDELAAAITSLEKAELAYNIANATPGSGTAPNVTSTNHYVPTGSTEALVRFTATGSNILERGVCWSTEHNPTVLDERTTKSFSLNGYIYHIKGLEPATVYYVRPYTMNKTYTVAYGDEIKIVTHPKGTCVGTWDNGAPDEAANARCRKAIQETIDYFNEWTGIRGFTLSGHYGSGTPTADCSYGGWMRIGPNAGNQAIGTVIHETGHGVGVGTQDRWWDSNVHNWEWKGREANDIYHFLENKYTSEYVMVGDNTHGWGQNATYDWFVNGADKDKHLELQYIGGCVLLYGLFIDGLCPTTSYHNGLSGYTYNFDDTKKYYIMNKDSDSGLGNGLLYQRTNTAISWKPILGTGEALTDSAAWNIEYNAQAGYYLFKNASTGRYLSHASTSSITAKNISSGKTPGSTEYFQLMPDRPATDVTIGEGDDAFTTHGYWFTWYNSENKSMSAGNYSNRLGYGTVSAATFNYADTATQQQWIIISEDEIEAYEAAAVATGIEKIKINDTNITGEKIVVGIYNDKGVMMQQTQKGLNIIRYNDGSSKKIYIK